MPPLRIRRVHFDAEGKLSKLEFDEHVDELSDRFVAVDRTLEALGVTDAVNLATLTRTITTSVAAAGNGGAAPPRRLAKVACVANQATYALAFAPDVTQVLMAWNRGLAMTPTVDFTISGSNITLEPGQVPTISEGYILVEGTPL